MSETVMLPCQVCEVALNFLAIIKKRQLALFCYVLIGMMFTPNKEWFEIWRNAVCARMCTYALADW